MSTRLNFYNPTSCKPSLSHRRTSIFLRLRWLGSYFPRRQLPDQLPNCYRHDRTTPILAQFYRYSL
ncbi:hypothetical protein L873DRAFT_1823396 [Choiromyces venosus 120613-1]|uniref:Uncharacterized protein n=1 Tax=Choiromyces venosus 120613-1 TaxID=1336337 RepID=A0A3N4IWF9_9PEZI|nr:hypothetical protein L873DRAFT_1823396 [Choiromyces venosus 120613-1]